MLCRKAEILVFIQKAGNLAAADEAILDLIHPLAESALQSYMQQHLSYTQHVEYYPKGQPQLETERTLEDVDWRSSQVSLVGGRAGTEFLQLKHLPVALTGIEVREDVSGYAGQADPSFGDDTVLTLGSEYFLDIDDASTELSKSGILYRVGSWPAEPRSVKVSYYGGLTSQQLAGPAGGAVKLAALHTVSSVFWKAKQLARSSGMGPYTSESIGKWSGSVGQMFAAANLTFGVPADAVNLLAPYVNWGRLL